MHVLNVESQTFFFLNFSGPWKNCILLFKTIEYTSYASVALESVFFFLFVLFF